MKNIPEWMHVITPEEAAHSPYAHVYGSPVWMRPWHPRLVGEENTISDSDKARYGGIRRGLPGGVKQ